MASDALRDAGALQQQPRIRRHAAAGKETHSARENGCCSTRGRLMIQNFTDFRSALAEAGFSMGGGNAKGIYAVIPYSWEQQDAVSSPVKWHTGDAETDPWEWRMRMPITLLTISITGSSISGW